MTFEQLLAWIDSEGQNDRRNSTYGLYLIAGAILELAEVLKEK